MSTNRPGKHLYQSLISLIMNFLSRKGRLIVTLENFLRVMENQKIILVGKAPKWVLHFAKPWKVSNLGARSIFPFVSGPIYAQTYPRSWKSKLTPPTSPPLQDVAPFWWRIGMFSISVMERESPDSKMRTISYLHLRFAPQLDFLSGRRKMPHAGYILV